MFASDSVTESEEVCHVVAKGVFRSRQHLALIYFHYSAVQRRFCSLVDMMGCQALLSRAIVNREVLISHRQLENFEHKYSIYICIA